MGRIKQIGVATCVGLLAVGCGGDDDDADDPAATTTVASPTTPGSTAPPATATPSPSPPTTAMPTEGLIAAIEVLGSPDWLATDEHGLWVKLDNSSVVLIDPATNQIVDAVDLAGDLCQGLGAGDGSIWACSDSDVARIDATYHDILAVIPAGKAASQGELAV